MEKQNKRSETGTQSIERTISILNCFLGEKDALSLTEIAKKTGIPIPTASRITRLLAQEGYLARNEDNKFFKIGRKIYMLGYRAKKEDFLRNIIYETLLQLRNEFDETSTAYIRQGLTRICFEKVEADHGFHYSPTVGATYEMGVGAGAKAFLAFMSEEESEQALRFINPLTCHTITDKAALRKELEEVERTKISKSFDEYCVGFSSLASPVFDSTGEVLCTIAITGPTSRFTPSMLKKATARLVSCCKNLSADLGWPPGGE